MKCPNCGEEMERLFKNAFWFGVQVCTCGCVVPDETEWQDDEDDYEGGEYDDDSEGYPVGRDRLSKGS